MLLQYLVQKWRIKVLSIFRTEVQDICSSNIFLKLLLKLCSIVFVLQLIQIYCGNKIVVTTHRKIFLGKKKFLN